MDDKATSFLIRFKAGECIFTEGEPGQEMFIIQKGEVAVFRGPHTAARPLALLEEGDFFGEIAILEDLPRETTAKAQTDCELVRIDRSTFNQLVRFNPEVPIRMLRKLSRRLRELIVTGEPVEGTARPGTVEPEQEVEAPKQPALSFETAHLTHTETGTDFPLSGGEQTRIGRADPVTGLRPDIELKPIDSKRSTSRRHARIVRRGDQYFMIEEIGVANGTSVNGKRISAGNEVELADGDEVAFGYVVMVFHTK